MTQKNLLFTQSFVSPYVLLFFLLAGFFFFSSPASAAPNVLFPETPPLEQYTTGTNPASVYSADFSGDNAPDIAVANRGGANVSVLLNDGNGTYANAVDYSVGTTPRSVTGADIDDDNDMDLIVANSGSDNISVLLNDGTGSFSAAVHYPAGTAPYDVDATDVNGDNFSDLVVANADSDNFSVLINNNDGTFAAPVNYGTIPDPHAVTLADFDGDQDKDVAAVQNDISSRAHIFLNDGDGTFSAHDDFSTGGSIDDNFAEDIQAGDFNGDGNEDLAAINSGSDNVAVFFNDGNANFGGANAFEAGGDNLFVADIDNDSDSDILTAEQDRDIASVLQNDGAGNFTPAHYLIRAATSPADIFAADTDADNDLDIITANLQSDNVSLLPNNGDGSFQTVTSYRTLLSPRSPVEIDADADNDKDLAILNSGSNRLTVMKNDGDGTFPSTDVYSTESNSSDLASGDLDGDGNPDLAVANSNDDSISVYLNNGDGTFQSAVNHPASSFPDNLSIKDLNNDAAPDLAIAHGSADNVSVMLNNGDATFSSPVTYSAGNDPEDIVTADIDGDDDIDIATANRLDASISVFLNNGDGSLAPAATYDSEDAVSLTSADFNNDGSQDFATGSGQGISVLLNNGDGTLGDFTTYGEEVNLSHVESGDLNGDGNIDIIGTSPLNDNLVAFFNDGNGAFTQEYIRPTGDTPIALKIADFDSDSALDLVVANSSSSNIGVYLNTLLTVNGISPSAREVGREGFTLTVNGQNFDNTSTVRFDGTNRETTNVDLTQLTAEILQSDLTTEADYPITVYNSSTETLSTQQTFSVTADTTPPSTISDLSLSEPTSSSVSLTWTAPGDSGTTGTASVYDIRYSTEAINDNDDFNAAVQVTGEPVPEASGTQQGMTVEDLRSSTEYHFAMKTRDEVPNISALSNIVSITTTGSSYLRRRLQEELDTEPPERISDLAATEATTSSVLLSWTAPTDIDGNRPAAYDIRYSTSPITTDEQFAEARIVKLEPLPKAEGTNQTKRVTGLSSDTTYYFAIKSLDDVPNISPLSNTATVATQPAGDEISPSEVSNLSITEVNIGSIDLTWLAPGDDQSDGTASFYDIRYATSPIEDKADFKAAMEIISAPVPESSGTPQTVKVTELTAGTEYHFAILTGDDAPNHSEIATVTGETLPSPDTSLYDAYSHTQAQQASPNINTDKNLSLQPLAKETRCISGARIKIANDHNPETKTDATVYYCGADGKRYPFPNEAVYFSWYEDFSDIRTISKGRMNSIEKGENVTFRPGAVTVKIQSSTHVYAIARGGSLRHIKNENVAERLYGSQWHTYINDIPKSLFTDYIMRNPIELENALTIVQNIENASPVSDS